MRNPVMTVAMCLLLSLAFAVPASANSAIGLDPLALPYFNSAVPVMPLSAGPADGFLAQTNSVTPQTFFQDPLAGPASRLFADNVSSLAGGGIAVLGSNGGDNTDLRSLLKANSLNDNRSGLSGPNFSVSSDFSGLNVTPETPTIPEPNEFSLLLVGLAAIVVFLRLAPRKV